MTCPNATVLVWLRRDLRLNDHRAIDAAVITAKKTGKQVSLVFVFDREILDSLPRTDRRVTFIHDAVSDINQRLRAYGAGLHVCYGHASEEIPTLASALNADEVFAATDYEPQAIARDEQVKDALTEQNAELTLVSDHTLHVPGSIMTGAGKPYTVFTPFKKNFLAHLTQDSFEAAGTGLDALATVLNKTAPRTNVPSLDSMGFDRCNLSVLGIEACEHGAQKALSEFASRIHKYEEQRNYPGIKGPSYLSVHFRFGTVSIRHAARLAQQSIDLNPNKADGARTWLSELLWRDFYFQILHHFPHAASRSFKPEYDRIEWVDEESLFEAWCQGQTGYPLIDAAMAQINQTGYMHNRLRMVVASFLTKDLGIHWQRGENYFALKLNDFDLAANNGGWQWAASSGCDAQPYFRIFNPTTQSERFDPKGRFIRRYLPKLAGLSDKQIHAPWLQDKAALASAGVILGQHYPAPIVDHATARQDTLARYAVVKSNKST